MSRSATNRAKDEVDAAARVAKLTAGYTPLPGIPDEFIGADGQPRAHWLRFLDKLMEFSASDMNRRFATADRHIRDTGVSYRAYGDTSERAWPLSHVPLLIEAGEWREIAEGIEQRARLLELVLADIYGEGQLIDSGDLPAAAVTGSPEFLHPLHGVKPPGGKFLHIYAADIGRGPDGRWWVLGDRSQAPSGAGYALANRLVLARAFPALYRDMNVERLAPFFEAFRLGLTSMAQRSNPRICLLTPGPFNETYFEQAYLARYLGLLLVEGGDLTMRDGKVNVRTIAGLKRADVIWRRIDSDFADPLELNAHSRLGVPGLVDALREGGVVIANALGSGVLEAPAMMSFMPKLCRKLLGEELRLPNIATWWCGQEDARQSVIEDMDELAIAGAYGNPVPGFASSQPLIGASLTGEEKSRLVAALAERGVDYAGQEVVNLSTTPVWHEGRLEPRPFVLRVYAAHTPQGWKIMPGGFCRISGRTDARAVSMGEGVQSADVWVLADKPVEMVSLLPTDETVRIRRIMGTLPSRAADNLFWLGRYLERSEATLRLIRCLASRMIETGAGAANPGSAVSKLSSLLTSWHAAPRATASNAMALVAAALHGDEEYGSAVLLVRDARRAASFIRERLSTDTWRLIGDLNRTLTVDVHGALAEAEAYERADAALRIIAAISGLAQENMNRGAGWRIFDAGRRIDRGINTCRFARHFASGEAPADDLDVLLDLVDSQITYRSRYLMGVNLNPVRDMVVLDPFNPRSVAFQIERLDEHLETLPLLSDDGMLETPRRLILQLAADAATATAASLNNEKILGFEQSLLGLADAIAARYFLQGPHVARADKSSGLA
ncbi:circularly permuted type 2 ATP-grasp protein [Methylocapsa sp. D3K7]|uniref:circularly permuted type 2 ATP-grasp protein n=1 Tax=Methylocapsa sp. D3K7 TaxID=3041435 RepID=UPI00244EB961|nr:circularly permuted type 2 ATP-grasp protein [Methylocapsa sp. D3K7]WGJ16437.1 circularly permuted type 2 ATP-grasp protein [Methylocapsa sp. D3K7]